MIIKHCFDARSLILTAALLIGLGFVTHATAEQHSLLIDLDSKLVTSLGSLGGGGTVARDINDAGQVVGSSKTASGETHAFLTGPNGMGMSRVGMSTDPSIHWSEAVGINNAGQVIGNYPSYYVDPEEWFMRAHSFKTGSNGEGRWGLDFQATGINDAGVVVGWDFPKQPFTSSWLIYPAAYSGVYDGGTERISGLLSFGTHARLLAVNNSGQAVGVDSGNAVLGSLYYPYTPLGLWTDIGALARGYYSEAVGINEAGQVIGSYKADGVSHAFITNAGGHGTDRSPHTGRPWQRGSCN